MKPVLALAALLLAALIGLTLWLTIGTKEPISTTPIDAKPAPATDTGEPTSVQPSTERKRELDQIAGSSATADPRTAPRTYVVGDAIVHDRRADGGPLRTKADFTPPEGIHLTAEFASQVTTDLQPAAKQCMQTLPEAARSEKTKLNVTMTVRVKNGSLTVSEVAAKVAGVEDSVLAPTLACLRQQMVGSSLAAAGQPDVDAYPITTYYTP
jgi:cytoskeletal protein RodZ